MANKKGRSLSDNDMSNVTGGMSATIQLTGTPEEIDEFLEKRKKPGTHDSKPDQFSGTVDSDAYPTDIPVDFDPNEAMG